MRLDCRDVRSGSKAEVEQHPALVRFSLNSGHGAEKRSGELTASSRHGGRGARQSSEQNCFSSKLLAISGVAPFQPRRGCFQLDKPCSRIASTHHESASPTAKRYGVTAVYLLRSATYQFCNCGVLCIYACRGRLALNQLWDNGG
jgi:hypothetical protein